MNVLQIHTRYRSEGGEDSVLEAEAALLRAGGHRVHQVLFENPQERTRAAVALSVAPWNPIGAGRVSRALDRFRPDVAHVHNTWFAASAAVLSPLRRRRVPVVMTLHNYRLTCANALLYRDGASCRLCVGASAWHGARYRCYRSSWAASAASAASIVVHRRLGTWARSVDLFLAPSEFSRRLLAEGGLPIDRIHVKPNPVSDPGIRSVPPSTSTQVLYVGRVSAEKGIGLLMDAWAVRRRDPLELLVVGDGPLRHTLEARSVPGVRFVGHRTAAEVQHLMLAARALASPSLSYETFGMAAAEAMAAGLPALVSDVGALAELTGDGQGGWPVAPNVAAWDAALSSLADSDRLDACGGRGRRRYEDRLSREASAASLERAYAVALSRAGARGAQRD